MRTTNLETCVGGVCIWMEQRTPICFSPSHTQRGQVAVTGHETPAAPRTFQKHTSPALSINFCATRSSNVCGWRDKAAMRFTEPTQSSSR